MCRTGNDVTSRYDSRATRAPTAVTEKGELLHGLIDVGRRGKLDMTALVSVIVYEHDGRRRPRGGDPSRHAFDRRILLCYGTCKRFECSDLLRRTGTQTRTYILF